MSLTYSPVYLHPPYRLRSVVKGLYDVIHEKQKVGTVSRADQGWHYRCGERFGFEASRLAALKMVASIHWVRDVGPAKAKGETDHAGSH